MSTTTRHPWLRAIWPGLGRHTCASLRREARSRLLAGLILLAVALAVAAIYEPTTTVHDFNAKTLPPEWTATP
jgi:hypothetical protein